MWQLLQNYKKYMVIQNQSLKGNMTIFQKVVILKMFMDHFYSNKKKPFCLNFSKHEYSHVATLN